MGEESRGLLWEDPQIRSEPKSTVKTFGIFLVNDLGPPLSPSHDFCPILKDLIGVILYYC